MAADINTLREAYKYLGGSHRNRAQSFFNRRPSHLAWSEAKFLKTLNMIATKTVLSAFDPKSIKEVDLGNRELIEFYDNLSPREEHLREIGGKAIAAGEIMAIDLVAGMATGFGRTAKGAVRAVVDVRYDTEQGTTYYDLKKTRQLQLQRKYGRLFIGAAMVSDETEPSIRKNLEDFGRANKIEVVIIDDGTPADKVKEIYDKYKDRWQDSVIVPLIRQPSNLYISKDASSVGEEYMMGHGDFFDVVKSQLQDIIRIFGVKFIFSSNIDNTGADVSESILGYMVEESQNNKIQAMVEVVQKSEGDKGGVPALIDGKPSILEEAFVPKEIKDDFLGTKVFPYFNTNTFWWSADAILNTEFTLPLMITKEIADGSNAWMKVESIMGHGLNNLKFKALVVDRGLRFLPAKFLTDVWIGRSDWMMWWKGRLIPAMQDGEYVPKPLVEVSGSVFSNAGELDKAFFGHGAFDHMRHLRTMAIGGAGKHFGLLGRLQTHCGVSWVGDVAIIFEKKQDRDSGTLVIQGKRNSDMITIADSVILVPAGETIILNKSVKGFRDPRVKKEDLVAFLKSTEKRWPESQRARVVDKFFSLQEKPAEGLISFQSIFTPKKIEGLTAITRENVLALMEVFNITGYLRYKVTHIGKDIFIDVISKSHSAKDYKSKADDGPVKASPQKAYYLKHGDRVLMYSCQNFNCILIPMGDEAILLTGTYNAAPDERKPILLKGKLDFIASLAEESGTERDDVEKIFKSLSWAELLEQESRITLKTILARAGVGKGPEEQA